MAIIKCPNNHYFDNNKYKECPHCAREQVMGKPAVDTGENKTVAMYNTGSSGSSGSGGSPMSLKQQIKGVEDSQKTVGIYMKKGNMNPVAGWLVCRTGENKGRSFEVHVGKNFVGRALNMDIVVNDEKISRDSHYSLIFEPHATQFFIVPGNGITYINGELLSEAQEIVEGDEIEAGSSKYLFVPFCKEGRDWNE